MAQFYAEIKGNRGRATRTGTKTSGICGYIRRRNIGAVVFCDHVDGKDVVTVYKTAGSNARTAREKIAEFTE